MEVKSVISPNSKELSVLIEGLRLLIAADITAIISISKEDYPEARRVAYKMISQLERLSEVAGYASKD